MSDFHSITPYGSKVCHGSVMGVTVPPPLGMSPQRPRRKKGKHVYTSKKKWKGKLGKSSEKFKKKLENMLQISPGMEERERKKEKKIYIYFWGGIGMLT